MPRMIEVEHTSRSHHMSLSQAASGGDYVFVSGQFSSDEHGFLIADSFANEMRRAFSRVSDILAKCGLTLDDVVSVETYVQNVQWLDEYEDVSKSIMSPPFPSRTTLVGCLGGGVKYAVDVVAARRVLLV